MTGLSVAEGARGMVAMRRTIEIERTAIDRKTVLACDNCGLDSPLGNDQMPKTWYRVEHAGWGWTVPEMHACTDTCLVTLFGGVMPSSEGAVRDGE